MDKITFYSIAILVMLLALPVISYILRKTPHVKDGVNILLLAVYVAANLYLTLLSRETRIYHHLKLTPFWSYIEAIDNAEIREEVILNIILYIPFGYLMHIAFPKLKWWFVILCGFCLSCITELSQLFFKLGLCETDDVISNTTGTIIGVGLYKGYKKLIRKEKTEQM